MRAARALRVARGKRARGPALRISGAGANVKGVESVDGNGGVRIRRAVGGDMRVEDRRGPCGCRARANGGKGQEGGARVAIRIGMSKARRRRTNDVAAAATVHNGQDGANEQHDGRRVV